MKAFLRPHRFRHLYPVRFYTTKTHSGHRVGRWRSAGAVAEALSVNAKMVVPKRPGRFYGVRCQFLVPILCFDVDLQF